MKKNLLMLVTIVLCMSAYAQEAKKDLPLPAREVVERMEKEILAAKQKAIQGLTKVLSDVVKTGNLEAANKVKTKLEEITSDTAGSSESKKKQPWFIGQWHMVGSDENKWRCVINKDGTATAFSGLKEISGKWEERDKTLYVSWESGVIDRISIPKDKQKTYFMKNSLGNSFQFIFDGER